MGLINPTEEIIQPLLPRQDAKFWHELVIVRSATGSGFSFNAPAANAGQFSAAYINPATDLDELTFFSTLAAGNYRLEAFIANGTNRGILETYWGTTLLDRFDYYTSATSALVRRPLSFTVKDAGIQQFRFRVNGKNAASTGFFAIGSLISIKPVL